ncbi:spermidine/putrescine ABC transporter substrate-binding protein [Streptomyces sp. MJP52]|uniref:polyamine ABC transporter substrate-binding protein n=1 Tax=Streptomyces sp. MJP52 TaxID=2940555 RepID=UPI002473C53C|nr:spermidine/putrescine ABC transporter substrate-binding protein [Streptomyces sp. MJP52]MDH6224688.1 spermidine/putrescine transport system substrate-binding protein [Streptomyces sp. MJP52]
MEQYEPDRPSPAPSPARPSPVRGTALTRRSLLRASVGGVFAAGGAGALGACGIPPAGDARGAAAADDRSAQERTVSFSNWTEYMDVDESETRHPTLEAFTRQTGVQVEYSEDINDNNEFFAKIKPQLAAGQDTGRDLVCVTDWLAARMIRLGWAQKLDPSNLPTAYANLSAQFRSPDWDPGRAYSYPWTAISTVIAYNKKALDGIEVRSVSDLLDNPRLKGRVGMLTEMRDTMGMALLDMGKDPGDFTDDDYDAALARLQKAVDRGQIRRFTGNDYTADLTSGDFAACLAWAGDVVQLKADSPEIDFVVPDSGYLTSTDNLLVPAHARHKTNAERLIDHYYQPAMAARLAAYINYVCPVDGVKEELAAIAPDAAADPLILPDRAMAERSRAFRSLSDEEETAYEAKFAKLTGA